MDVQGSQLLSRDERLTALVGQHQGLLLRMCYVLLRDQELARDAVQETFLKAYRRLDSFRGDCSERSWLMRIAINTCRDLRRSAWFRHVDRRVVPEELPLLQTPPNAAEAMDVMRSVLRLPPALREVVLLHYWQGMSVGEMAQLLGVAHSTVSYRLKRAQARLREVLEGGDEDE